MLSQKNRLKKKKDFERIAQKGKFFKENFLILKKVKNNLQWMRIGFVVSQKISKKAVERNKIKRKLRETVRANLDKIIPGYDIVFFTKKGIEKEEFSEIKNSVEKLLRQAKLLND